MNEQEQPQATGVRHRKAGCSLSQGTLQTLRHKVFTFRSGKMEPPLSRAPPSLPQTNLFSFQGWEEEVYSTSLSQVSSPKALTYVEHAYLILIIFP